MFLRIFKLPDNLGICDVLAVPRQKVIGLPVTTEESLYLIMAANKMKIEAVFQGLKNQSLVKADAAFINVRPKIADTDAGMCVWRTPCLANGFDDRPDNGSLFFWQLTEVIKQVRVNRAKRLRDLRHTGEPCRCSGLFWLFHEGSWKSRRPPRSSGGIPSLHIPWKRPPPDEGRQYDCQ
jgi:hypothetical protein